MEGAGSGRVGVGPVIVTGLVIIALFFGGFGSWAALAPLDSAAIAPGVVSGASNRKTVQHLEGGIVGQILVRDGDDVTAGQVLIRLDETRPRAILDLLRGRQRATAALATRLIAERDERDEIEFPAWLLTAGEDPGVAAVIAGERSIFEARKDMLAGQIAVLRQRRGQFSEEIKGIEGQITAGDTQLRLIAEETAAVEHLIKKGLERKPRLLALQRRSAGIEGNRSQNQAFIARAKQNIGEARLRIAQLESARMTEVVEQLREVQEKLFDLDERIRAAKDVLRRTEIRAVQAGTVVGLQVNTPGGVIGPGEPLLDIVPRDTRLIVETFVDPKDIDVVHAGLAAKVRLTAFTQRHALPIDGRVLSVSADILIDDRTGDPYYLVRVELTGDPAATLEGAFPGFPRWRAPWRIYPGMQAEVMIISGERTALEYFLAPITRSLNRAFRED